MRYTDEQIGRLYDGLDERGFFETGHLVIVGDHRAMLAITRGEVERVGLDKAYTQVPAVVISRTFAPEPVVMDSPYSQVDLANTMMASFDGAACHGDFQGLIWGESAAPATYILHRRGDRRHQFSVFSDGNFGVVTLGGDKTNLSGTGFTQRDQSKIVDFVNATRIKAQMAKQSR
jgi:arylsulfatase A-like enzyme